MVVVGRSRWTSSATSPYLPHSALPFALLLRLSFDRVQEETMGRISEAARVVLDVVPPNAPRL